jgi:methionine-rich copper-binding protein CopC
MTREPLLSTLLGVTLLLASAGVVHGHARFLRSEPAPDSVAAETPAAVTIWFGELLEVAGSSISVFAPDGSQVDLGDSGLLPNDHKALAVSLLPDLPPGAYTAIWENVSAEDGDASRGEFVFTIGTSEARGADRGS